MADESGERHDMTDAEWEILEQCLPTGRAGPERKDDRRVMNGTVSPSGAARRGATFRSATARSRPATTGTAGGAGTGHGRRSAGKYSVLPNRGTAVKTAPATMAESRRRRCRSG